MTASGAGPESAGAERSNEIIDGLERLADMYQQGLLTDEEFAEAKSRLLLRRDPSS